jgi:uncharacterized C2H2 Zn-finger protein
VCGEWDQADLEAARRGQRLYYRDRASQKRLAAAWAERDAMLDGEEGNVSEQAEFRCDQCGKAFGSRPSLAGHTRQAHGRRSRGRRGGARRQRPSGPPCPMCATALPAEVGVLADQLEAEGLDDEKALRAAVICWAGLRVPGA